MSDLETATARQLADLHNQIPGIRPMKKFETREVAIRRTTDALNHAGKLAIYRPETADYELVDAPTGEPAGAGIDLVDDDLVEASTDEAEVDEAADMADEAEVDEAADMADAVEAMTPKQQLLEAAKVALGALRTLDVSDGYVAARDRLIAAIDRAESARKQREPRQPRKTLEPGSFESGKRAVAVEMLRRPDGATVSDLTEATGWSEKYTQSFFSKVLRKKLGWRLTCERAGKNQPHTYRLAD